MTASDWSQLGLVALVGLVLPSVPWLPIRMAVLVPVAATTVSPWAVAGVASAFAAFGTLPLYAISRSARTTPVVQSWLRRRWVERVLGWLNGRMFISILVFALFPLPDQLMSFAGGIRRYPAWKFVVGFFLGRLPYFLGLAFLGAWNREAIQSLSEWLLRVIGL